jgi:hypothetical protein
MEVGISQIRSPLTKDCICYFKSNSRSKKALSSNSKNKRKIPQSLIRKFSIHNNFSWCYGVISQSRPLFALNIPQLPEKSCTKSLGNFKKKNLLFRFGTLERDFELNFSLNVTSKLRAVVNPKNFHAIDRSTVFPPFFKC